MIKIKDLDVNYIKGKGKVNLHELNIVKEKINVILFNSRNAALTLFTLLSGDYEYIDSEIKLDDQMMQYEQYQKIIKKIQFIIFSDGNLLHRSTVLENIYEIAKIHKIKESTAKKETIVILEKFNLEVDILKKQTKEIKIYEQQLIMLICALITQKQIIILENPAINMSLVEAKKYMEIVQEVKETLKITLVILSSQNFVASYADRVYGLNEHRVNYIK